MPLVDVDGIGTVDFPDGMSSEDISGAIRQHLSRARSAGLQATVSAGLLPAQILTAPGVAEASEMGQQQGRMSRFLSTPEELPPATNEERSARDALLAPTSDEAFLQNINTPRAMRIAGIRRAQEASTPGEFTPSPEAIQSAYNETARWVNPPKAAIQTAWGALREAQQSVGLPEAPDPNAKLLPPGAAKNIVDFWADSLMPSDVGGNLGPAGEGIKQAATDVLEGMTKGDAATMLTGPIGGAGYALEMAHGAPDQAAQLGQAVGSGDAQSASKALANLAFSVVAPGELVHGMARLASPRSIPIPDYPGARIESPQGARVPRAEAPAPLETVPPEVSAAQALRMTREATGEEPVNAAQFRAPKPTVPEAGIEPIPPSMTEHAENLTGLNLQIDQVVRAGAKTKEAIRELFPDMNRQQAAQLRDLVWNSPESGPGKALLDSLFRKPYLEDPKLGDAMNEAEMFRRAEDMINKAKEQNAKAIRGNQGQLPESGSTAEGGEAVSRNDVQPPPPGQPQSVVQGEAPSAPEVASGQSGVMTPQQALEHATNEFYDHIRNVNPEAADLLQQIFAKHQRGEQLSPEEKAAAESFVKNATDRAKAIVDYQKRATAPPEVKTLDDILGMTPAQISAWRKGTDPVEFGKSNGWNLEDVKAARDRLQKENADALEKIKALPPEQQAAKLQEWVANNEKAHALQEIVKGAEGATSPRVPVTDETKPPVTATKPAVAATEPPKTETPAAAPAVEQAAAKVEAKPRVPKARTAAYDKLSVFAKAAAGEFESNQKIIETGKQPTGKKATAKQIAELKERQKVVLENFRREAAKPQIVKPEPIEDDAAEAEVDNLYENKSDPNRHPDDPTDQQRRDELVARMNPEQLEIHADKLQSIDRRLARERELAQGQREIPLTEGGGDLTNLEEDPDAEAKRQVAEMMRSDPSMTEDSAWGILATASFDEWKKGRERRESGPGGGKLQDALDKQAEDALKRIRSREGGTTFGSGPLHELPNIKDYAIYGAAKLAKYGVRSAAWTKDMLDAFGKRIQPHLDAIFDAAKAHLEDFRRQTAKIGRATDVQRIIAENTGATREQPSNITQAVSALQTSLRTVRALQEHFTGGAKISKAELKVADDWLEADTNNIRQSLSDLVKRELPPEERGRFLTAILNATKRPSLLRPEVWVKGEGKVSAVEQMYRRAAEVAARIEDRSQEVVKAQVIGDLRDTVKRALSSPAVDIGYKSKILDLMKRVSFTKPTAETIAALKGTRDFLDRMAAQGKDVDMPREVLDQLEVLTKVPLRDMSPDAVRALAANISRLEEMGRLKVKALQAVWDAEKNSKLTELGQEPTTPIEKNPMLGHQPGDVDSATTKIRNYLRRTLNAAQLIDKALMPIDALFDMMGDRKGNYRGWLFKNVRGPLDLGFNAASVMRDRVNQPIVDLIKKYKMGEREAERIGTYAISLQDGGRERLIEMGVDPKRIDDIAKNLTPQEKAVYLQMRQAMDGLLPQLQKTMHELYNIDVKPVENYFPMPRDWEKMREIESPKPAKEPLFGTPMSFDELAGWKDMLGDFFPPKKTATERGFTIERVPKAMTPIKLNAFDTFYQHINDATYLLKTQRDLKMIGEMARNGGFEQKYGKFGQSLVLDFLDTFARQGRLGGMRRVPWLDELRTRSSAGIIGLRVASQFVHASNIALAAQRAGMDNYRAAMAQIASNPRARQFIADNFAEAFARGGGEPAMVEAASKDMSVFGKTIVPEKLVRASMVVARTIDRYNAEATMLGVYFKELRNKGIDPSTYLDRPVDPEAQAHAMVLARRAVASPLPKDVPMALSRGMLTGGNISLGRTLGQFQNIFLDQWSNIRHDLWRAGIREKNPKKAFAMFIAMAGTIFIENAIRAGAKSLIQGVTGAPPSKNEPGTGEKVMSEAVRRFPFGGQATAMLLYGRSGIPSIDLMMETAKAAHTVATTKNPHAGNRALVKAAGGVGQLMGVPGSGQAADIVSQSIK